MESDTFPIATAGYQDLPTIRRMAEDAAAVRASRARGLDETTMRRIRADDLAGVEKLLRRENVRIYKATSDGAVVGFIIVMLAFEHWVTGEFQAEINDLYVAPAYRRRGIARALLAKAERFVHSKGLKYLAVEVFADNVPALTLLERCGFVEEIKVLVREPAPRASVYPDFAVRSATAADFPQIRALAADTIVHSKPSNREIDLDMLRELYAMRLYDPVEARAARDAFYLVAETPGREMAGFLLAEKERDFFCNALQLKVVDIAVRPHLWGTHAAHALFNRLLALAREEEIPFVTGVIAAENRRSWLFFRKMWSCVEERRLLVRRVRMEGDRA